MSHLAKIMYYLITLITEQLIISVLIILTVSLPNYEGSAAEQLFTGQASYCGVPLQNSVSPLNHMDELIENPWYVPIYFYDVYKQAWVLWNEGILINNSTIIIADDDSKSSISFASNNLEHFRAVIDVERMKGEYDDYLMAITQNNFSQVVGVDRISVPEVANRDEILIGTTKLRFALLHLKQQYFYTPFTLEACIPLPFASNQSGSCNPSDILPTSRSMLPQFSQLFALHSVSSSSLQPQLLESLVSKNEMKLNSLKFLLWEDQNACQDHWHRGFDDAFPENNVFCLEIASTQRNNQVDHYPDQVIVLGTKVKISRPHFIAAPFVKQTFVAGIAVKPVVIHENGDGFPNEPYKNSLVYFFMPINVYLQGMMGQLSGKLGCDPFPLTEGSKSTCEYGENGWPYSVGSKVKVECKKHYISKEEIPYRKFQCSSNSKWKPQPHHFGCNIDCGRRFRNLEPLVVRGWPTTSLEFPWYGAIYLKSPTGLNNKDNYDFMCGSTLISKSVLVTAGHCVHSYETRSYWLPEDIRIVLGSNLRRYEDARKQGGVVQTFSVKAITIHPNFNSVTLENDIALIKLTEDVELTDHVLPACFPYYGSGFIPVQNGVGEVAGMGMDESGHLSKLLKTALLPIVDPSECERSLGRTISRDTQICAGYTNGTSTCKGDSGSGLVFSQKKDTSLTSPNQSGRFYIQGIVSNSAKLEGTISQCDDKNYVVFTNVNAFVDWVQESINKFDLDSFK